MAFNNLWRRKSRSFLVIGMIAFGLAAMIFSQGLYEGMRTQMVNDMIRTGSGEILIHRAGYRESHLLSDYIRFPQRILDAAQKQPEVLHVTARLKCEGVVASAKYARGAVIYGVDLEKEEAFIGYKKPMVQGVFQLTEPRTVLIGDELAEKLKVTVGKKIVLQGQSLSKEIVSMSVRIRGMIHANNPEIDASGVLMSRQALAELFNVEGVTEINILLREGSEAATVARELKSQLEDKEPLEFWTWQQMYPLLVWWEKMFDYYIYISYAVVFFVVALGIFFILFISVLERIKEFGILMAVGTPFRLIRRMLIWESLMMGLMGYILGAGAAYGLLHFYIRRGLDLRHFSKGASDIGMASVMFPDLKLEYFLLGLAAVIISSLVSLIVPLWKLRSLRAVEAIRFI